MPRYLTIARIGPGKIPTYQKKLLRELLRQPLSIIERGEPKDYEEVFKPWHMGRHLYGFLFARWDTFLKHFQKLSSEHHEAKLDGMTILTPRFIRYPTPPGYCQLLTFETLTFSHLMGEADHPYLKWNASRGRWEKIKRRPGGPLVYWHSQIERRTFEDVARLVNEDEKRIRAEAEEDQRFL